VPPIPRRESLIPSRIVDYTRRKMHNSLAKIAIPMLFAGIAATATAQIESLEKEIRDLSPRVFSDQELKSAREMVWLSQKSGLQAANRASSEAWAAISSRTDWEAFARPRLKKLESSLGPAFPEKDSLPLDIRITGETAGDGFRIQNVLYQSRPGIWVTANLYLPAKPGKAMSGLILCHSHHRPKEHSELQDMGMTWARHGCLVLVPDHLGHGERRQHPFAAEADFPREFPVSRQDYHFRYDTSIQLYLAGESLMGWLVWDLRRGVDFLLAQTGIDPQKIALLGAVAGGGDPTAVAAALDPGIAAAVPFNFGGPQPETRFPLPEDVEATFNYAGSGSWESTRNLHRSAADGFLPWVIVGGIAPRRLIFAHEFTWDRDRDPVWKRLQAIHRFYETPDHLAFTHGKGELSGRPPEASHCTHIGPFHRRLIHEAFGRWFGISATTETEYSAPLDPSQLRCVTPELEKAGVTGQLIEWLPRSLDAIAKKPNVSASDLEPLIGSPFPKPNSGRQIGMTQEKLPSGTVVERFSVESDPGITIPQLLLFPAGASRSLPVVIAVAQQGKEGFLTQKNREVAALLSRGIAVSLPDLRGCGEASSGDNDRGQRGTATSHSATALMLGDTQIAARLRDLNAVIASLKTRKDIDATRLGIWGESFTEPNEPDDSIAMPRNIDGRPRQSEPLGSMVALLAPYFEPQIRAVSAGGGIAEFRSVLTSQFVLIPHDAVIPGLLKVTDLPGLAASCPAKVRVDRVVDESNRLLPVDRIRQIYPEASGSEKPVAEWFAETLMNR
jgi:dienelactone hydrolase